MTDLPTLAAVFAVTPEQLTTMPPPQIDALNAALRAEYDRRDQRTDRAWESLLRALGHKQESVRHGNGWRQVWTVSRDDAETEARTAVREGRGSDLYQREVKTALDRLDACRDATGELNRGPYKVLSGEWQRRGGWSRFFEVTSSDDGHIHKTNSPSGCPSLRWTTTFGWHPELSGKTEADAVAQLGPVLCSFCFPSAPTEWRRDPAELKREAEADKVCPGSRQHVELDAKMARRISKYATCPECGEWVSVTSTWKLRKHDRPGDGEPAQPEAPAPQAPAADSPEDADRLVIIERQPQQPEEQPAPVKAAPAPSVTSVIRFLKTAGFQHSRYQESGSSRSHAGAKVTEHRTGEIRVTWSESDHNFFQRMNQHGITSASDMPKHPNHDQCLTDYADALSSRYTARVSSGAVYVSARTTPRPARPKGVPTAPTVRRALLAAGLPDPKVSRDLAVVDQFDHIRIAAANDDTSDAVTAALDANGWTYILAEAVEHFVVRVTGATADRPARVRALREQRAQQAAEEPEEQPERPAPVVVPEAAPEPPSVPQEPEERPARPPAHYSRAGAAYRVGMRVTYRDRTGMWNHGKVTEIAPGENGEQFVTFVVDAYQVAPARRAPKHLDNRPGKRREVPEGRPWRVPLNDKDLTREQVGPF